MLREAIGDGLHILAFGLRGISESRPATACFPDHEPRECYAFIPIYDLERGDFKISAGTTNCAKACADTIAEHEKCANTPQTAANVDIIIGTLGKKTFCIEASVMALRSVRYILQCSRVDASVLSLMMSSILLDVMEAY